MPSAHSALWRKARGIVWKKHFGKIRRIPPPIADQVGPIVQNDFAGTLERLRRQSAAKKAAKRMKFGSGQEIMLAQKYTQYADIAARLIEANDIIHNGTLTEKAMATHLNMTFGAAAKMFAQVKRRAAELSVQKAELEKQISIILAGKPFKAFIGLAFAEYVKTSPPSGRVEMKITLQKGNPKNQ